MSDYATTKQHMIDNCTDEDIKVEIETSQVGIFTYSTSALPTHRSYW